eukprot:scaffold9638_cov53-Isochrysis_galbana.AAC.1
MWRRAARPVTWIPDGGIARRRGARLRRKDTARAWAPSTRGEVAGAVALFPPSQPVTVAPPAPARPPPARQWHALTGGSPKVLPEHAFASNPANEYFVNLKGPTAQCRP